MKQFLILSCAAMLAGVFAVSCAQTIEKEVEDPQKEKPAVVPETITFTAHLEQGTRTALGSDLSVLWSPLDKILVYNADHPEGVEFTLTQGEGSPDGTFSGPVMDGSGPYYAVYPASCAGTMTGTAIPVNVPSTQTYKENSFGPGANLAAGKAAQLEGLQFHNLAGILALQLKQGAAATSVSAIRICSYDDAPLHGSAVIDGWDENGMPALTFNTLQETSDPIQEVELRCGEGVALSADGTAFYLAMPAGTLSAGYRIEVFDTENLAMVKYAKAAADNTISRNVILEMPELTYAAGYKADYLRSTKIGAIQNAGVSGTIAYPCEYVEGQGQYAYLNTTDTRMLRLQDWNAGYALSFEMPKALSAGTNASVTITSAGLAGIASQTVEKMRIVKISDNKVWMFDRDTQNGYILMMVEE